MSLKDYKAKRNFTNTKEPKISKKSSKSTVLSFVIQQHQARTLHYDFRLELNGVLKSWAVPKGPSLNPKDKRLAIQVEDHPFEYRHFEGSIPEGNYGAGDVIIWDNGYYEPIDSKDDLKSQQEILSKELEKGHLEFVLYGKKLNGTFALIRTKNSKQWLLIKKNDEYATDEDITAQNQSIISNRPVKLRTTSEKKEISKKSKSVKKKAPIPTKISPMLTTLINKPFSDPDWVFEIKWDGYRALTLLKQKNAHIYSRNMQSFDKKFSVLQQELSKLPFDACFDGEIVVLDDQDRPSFQALQNYLRKPEGNIIYYIFDLLYYNGQDLKSEPLIERKKLLKSILPETNSYLKYSEHIVRDGIDFFKVAVKEKFEGIIGKRAASIYLEGKRSQDWVKIKTSLRQEVIICGFTQPRGSRKNFGSLLLGVYKDNILTYVGHVGTGFDYKKLQVVFDRLSPLIQVKSPFATLPLKKESITWVKPELVCEVSFSEWTQDGIMRHPVFIDFREDKQANEVVKEKEAEMKEVVKKSTTKSTKSNSKLELTHLDKLYWPNEGYTKGDLIDYYQQVSSLILPYLKDRPESLRRFPNGIEHPGFFQKEASHAPSWMKTVPISHENHEVNYYLIEKEKDLLYLANLGCIDFNPFISRIQSLDYPDYLVLDLDPEAISFEKVIEVAQGIHELLENWQISSVCKTSGKRGMHIYIPLGAQYTYEVAGNFAKLLAYLAHQQMPKLTSVERHPKDRQKKVYIDFLQMRYGQTLVAPYSVRPIAGATISTPLKWSEVKSGLSPQDFTIKNAIKRFKKMGDLFELILGPGINIEKIQSMMEKKGLF